MVRSSRSETAYARLVSLSIVMKSFESAGVTTRITWGMTMRRKTDEGCIPSARAATRWPSSIDSNPPRMISAA